MKDLIALFDNAPYAAWAIGLGAVFYFVVAKGSGHLSDDNKARLSLYLEGSYKGSWAENFCDLFDRIFGDRHLSLKTFARSALASVIAVAAIYTLLGPILGLLATRSTSPLDLFTALAVGAFINILPDYLSLWETRALLNAFRRYRHPLAQLGLLILDLVFSAAIIVAGITAFLYVSGAEPISWVELVAFYSTYAVFFYSTFLTSLWAWAYCASSWFVKTFTFLRLHKLLDMKSPGNSLALTGALSLASGLMLAQPVMTQEDTWAQVDAQLCAWFPDDACEHAARLTKDQEQKLQFLATRCGGNIQRCLGDGQRIWKIEPEEAVTLWRVACTASDARSCTYLGYMYDEGIGVRKDYKKALEGYAKGCEKGYLGGCANLGFMYEMARGVPQDYVKAHEFYSQGCNGGVAGGCTNLGYLYQKARGVQLDYVKARDFYTKGCTGGHARGCSNLGWTYEKALGVEQDLKEAERLYLKACEMGSEWACEKMETFKDVPK